jgi:hypothetical protein
MAVADLIAEALVSLEEEATHLRILLDVFVELNPDQVPNWVDAVDTRYRPLESRLDALGDLIRRDALPPLRDLSAMTKPNGGMGVMTPMATQKAPSQLVGTRK